MALSTVTRYRRQFETSPLFRAQNSGSIAASANWIYSFEDQITASRKHLPFDVVTVTNNSSVSITFYPNQGSRGILVPSNTIKTFDERVIPALRSFKITNEDGSTSISAEELEVAAFREPVKPQGLFQQWHKRLFVGRDAERVM